MKIAVAASLHKKVNQDTLGGTEMLTYYLVEELVKRGHQVTLFATSDSLTHARLVSVCDSETANKKDGPQGLFLPYQLLLSRLVIERSHQFDVIHNNYFETFLFFAFSRFSKAPVVHTIHNDFFHFPKLSAVMKELNNTDFYVFVSQNALNAAHMVGRKQCIYNGIDLSIFPYSAKSEDYFVWLGRLTPKKGAKEAIEAAKAAGVPLKVAGAIDTKEKEEYFHKEIQPLLTASITFVGELTFEQKIKLLTSAKGLLAPIQWEEPFGLVMVEAMACGTPVIAYKRGAVPEIIKDGKTGFLVEEGDAAGMVEAIKKIDTIPRQECRRQVETHFRIESMVTAYEDIYQKVAKR